MVEVTRVPLQPVKKGSVVKLWLGLLALLAAAAALAWASMPLSLNVDELQAGVGPTAKDGDVVFVRYTGKLPDGTVFDRSQPSGIPPGVFPEGTPFPVQEGATVEGFYQGLKQVKAGGKYRFEIPAKLAYGDKPPEGAPIPPNTDLTFDVEVVEIMARPDFDRRLQALQMMMQQQQGGAPGGAPGAPGAPGGAAPAPADQAPPPQ
jgi:FKBP-type peptidyl-prolyl cis-trans isomerase FkpA